MALFRRIEYQLHDKSRACVVNKGGQMRFRGG